MARTWRTERTTPKKPPLKAPVRPRRDEFAREYYSGKGYEQEDTVTGDARAYLEADYG